jgi:serine/threonine protein kinase
MDSPRYQPELLREDAMFTLFRGRTPAGDSSVLLLAPASHEPSTEILQRLQHEADLTDKLDPEWAAKPLRFERYNGRPVLVLSDCGGVLLSDLLGEPFGTERFLRVGLGLTASLQKAHAQGLVHRDLKPSNVLVDASGRAWLTGFGLASDETQEQRSTAFQISNATPAYIAPEQTGRMSKSLDARSDLYSLGVVLYEMLTGDLPFEASDTIEWLHSHVARQPIPPSRRAGDIPAPLEAIVLRLLAKNADDRYQAAAPLEADLIRCLDAWTGAHRIDDFEIAAKGTRERLRVPEGLYGRRAGRCRQVLASP